MVGHIHNNTNTYVGTYQDIRRVMKSGKDKGLRRKVIICSDLSKDDKDQLEIYGDKRVRL